MLLLLFVAVTNKITDDVHSEYSMNMKMAEILQPTPPLTRQTSGKPLHGIKTHQESEEPLEAIETPTSLKQPSATESPQISPLTHLSIAPESQKESAHTVITKPKITPLSEHLFAQRIPESTEACYEKPEIFNERQPAQPTAERKANFSKEQEKPATFTDDETTTNDTAEKGQDESLIANKITDKNTEELPNDNYSKSSTPTSLNTTDKTSLVNTTSKKAEKTSISHKLFGNKKVLPIQPLCVQKCNSSDVLGTDKKVKHLSNLTTQFPHSLPAISTKNNQRDVAKKQPEQENSLNKNEKTNLKAINAPIKGKLTLRSNNKVGILPSTTDENVKKMSAMKSKNIIPEIKSSTNSTATQDKNQKDANHLGINGKLPGIPQTIQLDHHSNKSEKNPHERTDYEPRKKTGNIMVEGDCFAATKIVNVEPAEKSQKESEKKLAVDLNLGVDNKVFDY